MRHGGNTYQLDIAALEIPRCPRCGPLISTRYVGAQISQAQYRHVRPLLPAQIRAAREALGLQQEDSARRLGVAAESFCRWEKGALIQSRATDNLLRV
jgi:DNA-binding transcriptional regulator YiaG